MRTFRVSDEMFPWLQNIFVRDKINYSVEIVGNQKHVVVDLSGMKFREKMEDAMCERQMTIKLGLGPDQVFDSTHKSVGIPVYSAQTLCSEKKNKRLMRYYGHAAYQILEKDKRKVSEKMI